MYRGSKEAMAKDGYDPETVLSWRPPEDILRLAHIHSKCLPACLPACTGMCTVRTQAAHNSAAHMNPYPPGAHCSAIAAGCTLCCRRCRVHTVVQQSRCTCTLTWMLA